MIIISYPFPKKSSFQLNAGFLIYQSFKVWSLSPVLTNIETLPISKLQFPKVTVCPPRDTFTNLNYDIEMLGDKKIDADKRDDLIQFIFDEMHDKQFENMMKNLWLFHDEEDNIFYNWYHGYTKIVLPFHNPSDTSDIDLHYKFKTSLPYGSFKTPYYQPFYAKMFNKSTLMRTRSDIELNFRTCQTNFTLFVKRKFLDKLGKIQMDQRAGWLMQKEETLQA